MTHQERIAAMRATLKGGVTVRAVPQLFPTPPDLARRVVDLAALHCTHHVLEPSAGRGALTFEIHRRQVARLVAVEIDSELVKWLAASVAFHPDRTSNQVRLADFLECTPAELGLFDRVVMNPPFGNAADVQHINHARGFLRPGGRLVAICANGPRQRAALMPQAAQWIDLEPETFKESGTGVRAAVVVFNTV